MPCGILETLDLRIVYDAYLLERFYHLYMSAFPIEGERESLQVWESQLRNSDPVYPTPKFHLLVVGQHLTNPAKCKMYGGVTLEFFGESQCGLIAYLAVAPKYRGQGIAKQLLRKAFDVFEKDSTEIGKSLRGVFGETHDPRLVDSEQDSIAPSKRIAIMHHLGAQWIKIPYVEPEVNIGHGKVRNMILLFFARPGEHYDVVGTKVVKDFLYEFYSSLGIVNPKEDPDFQMMDACLGSVTVPLLSLETLNS